MTNISCLVTLLNGTDLNDLSPVEVHDLRELIEENVYRLELDLGNAMDPALRWRVVKTRECLNEFRKTRENVFVQNAIHYLVGDFQPSENEMEIADEENDVMQE